MPRSLALLLLFVAAGFGAAQETARRDDPQWLLPVPELEADPKVPTLKEVVGFTWGEDIISHAETERYLFALEKAAPERTRLETYGKSYQGRALRTLTITSPENLKRLEEIRADNLKLASGRLSPAEAEALAARAPAVVWLAYSVHGDETSPTDAALLTAYHLLADRRPETKRLLDDLVVIVDPLQNPDGRQRFIDFHRENRGAFVQVEPFASDRAQRWPGGRTNHYAFDMNRDWFLHTQQETRGRVAAFLRWKPQIFVDAHEMGADTSYFFDPPKDPFNPLVAPRQKNWYLRLGKNHAARFDQLGFTYFTKDVFDAFGPQYGSTWPTLHGSLGILWEQAGVRGKTVRREDRTLLHFRDGVRHHYVSGLATLTSALQYRRELLLDFHRNAQDALRLAEEGPVAGYVLLPGDNPTRAASLAAVLRRNGIEVHRTAREASVEAAAFLDGKTDKRLVPAGSWYVPVGQPAGRLVRTLLDKHTDMGEAFVKRQLERARNRLPDEIYDITSWSLPLAFGVDCLVAKRPLDLPREGALTGLPAPPEPGKAKVAYLVPGGDDAAPLALARWLRAGLRVHVADQPFRLQGVHYPRGSLVLRVAENRDKVHTEVAQAAAVLGVAVHPTDTTFVEEGASLGGPDIVWVKPPRVLLVVDRPTAQSAGHLWYLFDQVWKYPTTRVAGRLLGKVDLKDFDVLILPDGNYASPEAPSEAVLGRIRTWVKDGGTLIVEKGAAAWATGEKVKLLSTRVARKPAAKEEAKKDKEAEGEKYLPVPGIFVRGNLYADHWLTFGLDREPILPFSGNVLLEPLKETDGRNLITFAADPAPPRKGMKQGSMVSGFCWPETLEALPGKAYLVHQPLGEGHVVGFADAPGNRAWYPAAQRLYLNAWLFGPGH